MTFLKTLLTLACLAAISTHVDAAPIALNASTLMQNAVAAQVMNGRFITLSASSPCSDGETACIGALQATCASSTWQTTACSQNGTQCWALPATASSLTNTVTSNGTSTTASGLTQGVSGTWYTACESKSAALGLMAAAGINNGSSGGMLPPFFNWTAPSAGSNTVRPNAADVAGGSTSGFGAEGGAMNRLNSAVAGTETPARFQKTGAVHAVAKSTSKAEPTRSTLKLVAARSVSPSTTSAPTGSMTGTTTGNSTLSAAGLVSNARTAQELNAAFMLLLPTDACTGDESACVGSSTAQCVNGAWATKTCPVTGTECFALPSTTAVNATEIGCSTIADAVAAMSDAGVSGLYPSLLGAQISSDLASAFTAVSATLTTDAAASSITSTASTSDANDDAVSASASQSITFVRADTTASSTTLLSTSAPTPTTSTADAASASASAPPSQTASGEVLTITISTPSPPSSTNSTSTLAQITTTLEPVTTTLAPGAAESLISSILANGGSVVSVEGAASTGSAMHHHHHHHSAGNGGAEVDGADGGAHCDGDDDNDGGNGSDAGADDSDGSDAAQDGVETVTVTMTIATVTIGDATSASTASTSSTSTSITSTSISATVSPTANSIITDSSKDSNSDIGPDAVVSFVSPSINIINLNAPSPSHLDGGVAQPVPSIINLVSHAA